MSDIEDPRYYMALSDGEVWTKISNLTPNQKLKFDEAMMGCGSFRRALLIASSYPMEV